MKIEDLATYLGAEFNNHAWRGEINGYEFQITNLSIYGIKQYFASFLLNKPLNPVKIKDIKKVTGLGYAVVVSSAVQQNNVVSVGIRNIKNEKTLLKLKEVVGVLKQLEQSTQIADIYGHDEEVDAYKPVELGYNAMSNYALKGLHVPVNSIKFNEVYKEQVSAINAEETSNENLLKSLGLAVVGALLGAIPAWIAYELEMMIWLLYFIIPAMSFYLYKKGKGPQKTYIPFVIAAISLIVGVGSLVLVWYSIADFYGVTLQMLFEIAEVRAALISDFTFATIGNIIGIIGCWKYLYSGTTGARLKQLNQMK